MIITLIKLLIIILITTFWSTLAVITGPLNFFLPAYHIISTTWAKWLIWVGGVKIQVKGHHHILPDKSYIFISNHASLFDIPILLSSLKNEIKMIAKKELALIPIFGWSLVAGGYILINRNDTKKAIRSLKTAEKKLKKGTSILIFPEGTRSDNGHIQSFKKGAFILALQTKFDIIPITIVGSNNVMPKKSFQLRPVNVNLVIGEAISVHGKGTLELIEQVRDTIVNNHKEYSL